MPRVDADSAPDFGADLIWPPPVEDLDACTVVPLTNDELDQRLLLIGGFPMAEADPRLKPKPIGVFFPPATIGGFPVREEAPLFGAPAPLSAAIPPPLPEFAAPVVPPPLPVPPVPEPVLEPAAVAAAPIAIAPLVAPPIAIAESPVPEIAIMREAIAAAATRIADAPVSAAVDAPTRIDTATIERLFASTGMWGVRQAEAIRRPVEMAALLREPSSKSRRRATVGLLVAASLALVSWSEYRAQRQIGPEVPVAASEAPPTPALAKAVVPAPVLTSEPTPEEPTPERVMAPEPIATPLVPDPPAPRAARSERRDEPRDEPLRPTMRRAVATPVRWPSRPAVLPTMPTRPLPALAAPRVTMSVAVDRTSPAAAPTPTPVVAPPSPMRAAVPAAALDTPARLETPMRPTTQEDNVRDILMRWRTAYSQLDARAAKGVYPALDQRALERAFQNLKSQDVRFDHCELKLRDESAQADCVGRATYVPRIGSQTPITAPRAWRFDLKLDDRGWTIASARSS